jgi:NADH-quinone oxidoreductase subunit C
MESKSIKLSETLQRLLGDDLVQVSETLGETTANVLTSSLVRTLTVLRDNESTQFQQLIDICGVDYPARSQRFDVVYHLLSVHLNHRLRIKVHTDGITPVPSVIRVYPCANWFERETWDLFGIEFADHPDIRRLMT